MHAMTGLWIVKTTPTLIPIECGAVFATIYAAHFVEELHGVGCQGTACRLEGPCSPSQPPPKCLLSELDGTNDLDDGALA